MMANDTTAISSVMIMFLRVTVFCFYEERIIVKELPSQSARF